MMRTSHPTSVPEQNDPLTGIAEIPLYEVGVLGKASIAVQGRTVELTTAPGRGEFAAFAVVALPGIEMISRRIEVRIRVFAGLLTVGWFLQQEKRWITRRDAPAGDNLLQIIVPGGTRGGELIFQNNTEFGAPARALIEAITVYPSIKAS